MTTVLIADDHPIVLEGLVALFQGAAYSVVARCKDGQEVLQALQGGEPDILLLDINMPPPDGLEIARRLKEQDNSARIVLLTSSIDDAQALEAIQLGVAGLVLKESAPRQLLQCLDSVCAGGQWVDPQIARLAMSGAVARRGVAAGRLVQLTARELQVTRLVARGMRNKEIARELGITEGTVKMHMHSIYEKLGVSSRVELTNTARETGWV